MNQEINKRLAALEKLAAVQNEQPELDLARLTEPQRQRLEELRGKLPAVHAIGRMNYAHLSDDELIDLERILLQAAGRNPHS